MVGSGIKPSFDGILLLIEDLTVDEKSQLVKRLLGSLPSGVVEINQATSEQLGEMLRAIADRVTTRNV
jgi:hypothetical protein